MTASWSIAGPPARRRRPIAAESPATGGPSESSRGRANSRPGRPADDFGRAGHGARWPASPRPPAGRASGRSQAGPSRPVDRQESPTTDGPSESIAAAEQAHPSRADRPMWSNRLTAWADRRDRRRADSSESRGIVRHRSVRVIDQSESLIGPCLPPVRVRPPPAPGRRIDRHRSITRHSPTRRRPVTD